ncbi:unnamed protein product [Cyclocybe aegerita]|uniref:BZIP domain-containing protein n=1 Tax=Cyclocybe aegerita TaxID=1973307 RepID=A0A8S0VUQ9_CYCAE|nr:unnamed protein product [Cyclocybe aegerita]
MLSNKPTDNSMAATSTTNAPVSAAAVTTADLNAPLIPTNAEDHLRDIAAMLVNSSPEFQDMDDFEKYMTSPMPALDDDFGTSPLETPYADFLNTPLFPEDDDMLTSPYMNDLPLFPSMPDYPSEKAQESVVQPAPQFNLESLYTISPETPLLQSFDPSAPSVPRSALSTPPATVAKTASRRASSKATGIRKGITPDDLLDESAPTQPRKYTMPSVTSKKELPAVFARKRARSAAFGDEEDQLGDDLPPNPTEKDLIEAKRRQNTVAARRSRKRKLEQLQTLEKSRDEERALKEQWQERANMLLGVLRGMGVTYPDFPPDEVKYST